MPSDTRTFPDVASALAAIGRPVVLGGEVAALDATGAPSSAVYSSVGRRTDDPVLSCCGKRPLALTSSTF
jgi:hypothetical protein